jgi:ABC-type branched-subunit amino acid transport system permease subunit
VALVSLLAAVPVWPGAVARFVLDVAVVAVLARSWSVATSVVGAPFLAGALPAGIGTGAWWVLVAFVGVDPVSAVAAAGVVSAVVSAPAGVVLLRLAPPFASLGGLVAGAAAASFAGAVVGDPDRARVVTGLGDGPRRWLAVWLALMLLAAGTVVARAAARHRAALAATAWQDDPEVAATLGIDPGPSRLAGWVGVAALTGSVAATVHLAKGTVTVAEAFDVRLWVVVPLVVAGLGGTRTVGGPILGGVALVILERATGPVPALVVAAAAAAALAVVLPVGPDEYLAARLAPRFRTGVARHRTDSGSSAGEV